jgi:hypothetical protein
VRKYVTKVRMDTSLSPTKGRAPLARMLRPTIISNISSNSQLESVLMSET